MRHLAMISAFAAVATLGGCQTNSTSQVLAADQSAVALRSIQTRAFETSDRVKTMRTVIATLQDLGFVIDKADATLGAVSATKLDGYQLKMSVTVREMGQNRQVVRASAQYNLTPVNDPEPYQQFFAALEQGMFLTAQNVD